MSKMSGSVGLAAEAGANVLADTRPEQLDCGLSSESQVGRPIYLAHTARAEKLLESVMGDDASRSVGAAWLHQSSFSEILEFLVHGIGEPLAGLGAGAQKCEHLCAQRFVFATGLLDEVVAGFFRLLERVSKDVSGRARGFCVA